jgi:hypothetical protein
MSYGRERFVSFVGPNGPGDKGVVITEVITRCVTVRETATEDSPWYVVPADRKWFTRVIVAAAVIDALGSLDLRYPKEKIPAARRLLAVRKR